MSTIDTTDASNPLTAAAATATATAIIPATKRKLTVEGIKNGKLSAYYHGCASHQRDNHRKKEIDYIHIMKARSSKGKAFYKNSHIKSPLALQSKFKSSTDTIRFRKDAETAFNRTMILFLRRISSSFGAISNLSQNIKVQERIVATQIRTMYPPKEQDQMIAYCMKSFDKYCNKRQISKKKQAEKLKSKPTAKIATTTTTTTTKSNTA